MHKLKFIISMEDKKTQKQNNTAQEQMEQVQGLYKENVQLKQQNRQLYQEYQKITSVYVRLDYLFQVLRKDMCEQFTSDFLIECAEEVEELIRAFKMESSEEETREQEEDK